MNTVELVGFIAGIFVAASLLPQVIKSLKTILQIINQSQTQSVVVPKVIHVLGLN